MCVTYGCDPTLLDQFANKVDSAFDLRRKRHHLRSRRRYWQVIEFYPGECPKKFRPKSAAHPRICKDALVVDAQDAGPRNRRTTGAGFIDRVDHPPIHIIRIRHERRQPTRDSLCRKELAHSNKIVRRRGIHIDADRTVVVYINKTGQTYRHLFLREIKCRIRQNAEKGSPWSLSR